MPLTLRQMAEIQARVDAASPGPWVDAGWDIVKDGDEWMRCVDGPNALLVTVPSGVSDQPSEDHPAVSIARFITGARTDVPALLAEVERLQKDRIGLVDGNMELRYAVHNRDVDLAGLQEENARLRVCDKPAVCTCECGRLAREGMGRPAAEES